MIKKIVSVSSSGFGNGIKRILPALAMLMVAGYFSVFSLYGISGLKDQRVDQIYFKFHDRIESSKTSKYQRLLHIKSGDGFDYKRVRASMENLYKVGAFSNIEVRVWQKRDKKVDVYFHISLRYLIRSVKVVGKTNPLKQLYLTGSLTKEELKAAIFSLREGAYFEEDKVDDGEREVVRFLNSRGYFNPEVHCKVTKNPERFTVSVKMFVKVRLPVYVGNIDIRVTPESLKQELTNIFKTEVYVPFKFTERIEKAKRYLKKQQYYFPEITMKEDFPGPDKSVVKLNIRVSPGYRYRFNFEGMKGRINLISSIWEKKVFEKWAEKESKARILYFLKNKGYLSAEIGSDIDVNETDKVKTITFSVTKNQKYKLGKIHLEGNRSIPSKDLEGVIKTGDFLFNKFFHLRLSSLLVDSEILRLYYHFQGFPNAKVTPRPEFVGPAESAKTPGSGNGNKNMGRSKKVDVTFVINEGKKSTVDSILFEGNRFFTSQTLHTSLRTRANGPFVQQHLDEDIEKVRNLYHFYGFDKIDIRAEVTQGTEKSILIKVNEGQSSRMGSLIIIGVSRSQRKLIARLFPLREDQPYDQLKVDAFEREIENSGIFSRFKITKIQRGDRLMDLLINAAADYSKFYGFGVGWEKRNDFQDIRGTVEYQGRNIFRSYSTFSAIVQAGSKEQRGVLSYDSPYFFRSHITSSFKVWADREVYPSYQFLRFGIGESLVKKLTPESYILAALSWYQTELTDLEVPQSGIDQLKVPFNTTALDLSYVQEKRDDPFNPTDGTFFSSDLKVGFPLLEKDYSFVKFRFSYQRNFKFLKSGVFAVSVRNGLAWGGMSITERFFAGGVNSFRGTRQDKLGPLAQDPEPSEPGDVIFNPMGGNALMLFNFETTFPFVILPVSDFYYSIFADVGNVFERVSNINFGNLRTAVGFGIKYKTSLGPLRFDMAWDLSEKFTWRNFKVHIGIGNVF
ncbi:MAG: BamA/TamA family outer membrane protein [bacterium]|nr:BamA/TamA family outer membrane protein [bacterium]